MVLLPYEYECIENLILLQCVSSVQNAQLTIVFIT